MIEETEDVSFDESGRPVPAVQFDWDHVESELFGENGDQDAETMERLIVAFKALLGWVWQEGRKNADGLQLRAMVLCWIFLPELKPLQLSELARGFGKKKQSLGRHVDHFKRCFPVITSHMKPLKHDTRTK